MDVESPASALMIVRTCRADAASLQAFDRYAKLPGFDTVFCVDERAGVADMGGRAKIAFDARSLLALGLYPHPDCGWQCGDYCYHVVRAARPDYDFYWLIEPDVGIHTADLAGFFTRFADCDADLLAPRLTFNDQTWNWTKPIADTGLPPWRCFFPVTRLSGRAIGHVHAVRRAHAANPAIATPRNWPNDEGITASALADGGFRCLDLNHNGIVCHTGASLNGVALIDPAVLAAMPFDGLIYHPVRDFAPWFAAALEQVAKIDADRNKPANPARMSGQARHLTRMAQTCERHPDFFDASLLPWMMARELWAASRPPDTSSQPEPGRAFKQHADEKAARLCDTRLLASFGVTRRRSRIGTVHLAACRPAAELGARAAATDFEAGPPFALGHFPRTVALPYAWDPVARALVLTIHMDVASLLARPDLVAAQRTATRLIARVPAAALSVVPVTPLLDAVLKNAGSVCR